MTHNVHVSRGWQDFERSFTARCSCGWQDEEWHRSEDDACAAAKGHEDPAPDHIREQYEDFAKQNERWNARIRRSLAGLRARSHRDQS
jgi:hypothetical protein